MFRDFMKERPAPGTRILAFSPRYKVGDPMRLRMTIVMDEGMEEVTAYATEQDIEDVCLGDALFKDGTATVDAPVRPGAFRVVLSDNAIEDMHRAAQLGGK